MSFAAASTDAGWITTFVAWLFVVPPDSPKPGAKGVLVVVVAFVVVVIAVVIVVPRWPGSFCGGVVADLEPTAYTHV